MKIQDWVFKVVKEISPIDEKEHAELYQEIDSRISKKVTTPGAEGYVDDLGTKALIFFRNPWVRLFLSASFLFVIKYIKDWYNGKFDPKETE